MADVQNDINLMRLDVEKAEAAVTRAVRERRITGRGSPFTAQRDAELRAARKVLADAETQLRRLYESKGEGG